jgi:hypothetical protein
MATKTVVRAALNSLIADLREAHGENLASLTVYGSAAADDYLELRSDYNLLIALYKITPADLRASHAPMREWQRLGHPMPVYFTWEELQNAADVFPIEFHQMEQARVVLYGHDPFETLHITDEMLRHQTEYELRSRLLRVRRLYISASMSPERLGMLMNDSLSSFATLFGAALRLQGQTPPVEKPDCVRAATQFFGLQAEPFERIFALRAREDAVLSDVEANELFAAYLEQIEKVIAVVDGLGKVSGQP